MSGSSDTEKEHDSRAILPVEVLLASYRVHDSYSTSAPTQQYLVARVTT